MSLYYVILNRRLFTEQKKNSSRKLTPGTQSAINCATVRFGEKDSNWRSKALSRDTQTAFPSEVESRRSQFRF